MTLKKITKEHRPDRWITEVNSWLISRIELTHRPNNWINYLDEVYVLRRLITETLREFIYLVDNLYKKRYWDNVKAKRTMTKIESLKKSLQKIFFYPKLFLIPMVYIVKVMHQIRCHNLSIYLFSLIKISGDP